MRTTISLSDGLAEDVKRRAAEKGMSVSAFIESLIREGLHSESNEPETHAFRLVTVGGRGVLPGVELDRAARMIGDDDVQEGNLDKAGR